MSTNAQVMSTDVQAANGRSRRPVNMKVNGKQATANTQPRQHLADFLREELLLTGTHLGCEQGVCGACVVLMDGKPVRACLTYAVACDQSSVVTIEGMDDDPLMQLLRESFSREHALQCGYCTPGMLMTARDILLRHGRASGAPDKPPVSEQQIRVELSGNLCRCTGYTGIVNAIQRALGIVNDWPADILNQRLQAAHASTGTRRTAPAAGQFPALAAIALDNSGAAARGIETEATVSATASDDGRIASSFKLAQPVAQVWNVVRNDIATVVACLPGAEITELHDDGSVEGLFVVSMGPIKARIAGGGKVSYDDENMQGRVAGEGRDKRSNSQARGDITFALSQADNGEATKMTVSLGFELSGVLAQFNRSGLVESVVRTLIEQFRKNFEARLSGKSAPASDSISLFRLLAIACRHWLKRLFSRG